ncbi:beta-class carbonic anhydrase [Ferdinandcohnia quinoae]|uniref:carbonic anhydrase n=1 Tax=Fredinandcohnia quinoae TaxID=2918902 RepID=A0AAW5DXP1_9BACI|nr:carbonic anhydrase [Fredinandcohnia sp. SECRCQ15]MCH1625426.1 carbonic anhydrase [Fredinandcohnia sp. SECRCQ15]
MALLDQILEHNETFVESKEYEKYRTTNLPNKRMVIVTCMDTRLTELLPKAMNFKNGDVKLVKNAGAIVTHPFGSVMRSILVAVYELNADEVCIVGHHDCGMSNINSKEILKKVVDRGVSQDKIDTIKNSGLDLNKWFYGFESVEESVKHSVNMVNNHPLLPANVPVHGLVIDPGTGKLDVVVNGY